MNTRYHCNVQITKEMAAKVLQIVDAGLSMGLFNPVPDEIEAAISLALGLPHCDDSNCVSRSVRSLTMRLNDSTWSSNKARSRGLRRLALIQLGSLDAIDKAEFAKRVTELVVRKQVPIALRAEASRQENPAAELFISAALKCEAEGSLLAVMEAKELASIYASPYIYTVSADDTIKSINPASATCTYAAGAASAYAGGAYTGSAASAAGAADYAARSVQCAAYAADLACDPDKILADFAEDVVQILVEMKAPGAQWLQLTEAP